MLRPSAFTSSPLFPPTPFPTLSSSFHQTDLIEANFLRPRNVKIAEELRSLGGHPLQLPEPTSSSVAVGAGPLAPSPSSFGLGDWGALMGSQGEGPEKGGDWLSGMMSGEGLGGLLSGEGFGGGGKGGALGELCGVIWVMVAGG